MLYVCGIPTGESLIKRRFTRIHDPSLDVPAFIRAGTIMSKDVQRNMAFASGGDACMARHVQLQTGHIKLPHGVFSGAADSLVDHVLAAIQRGITPHWW